MVLIIASRSNNYWLGKIRIGFSDIMAPVMGFISKPASYVIEIGDSINGYFGLYSENKKLKLENEKLQSLQLKLRDIEAENKHLRNLLKVIPDKRYNYMTSRIVSLTGGAYLRQAWIASGSSSGIEKGQVIMAKEGLVGRINEVSENNSKVLLITDINSRIPVVTSDSRELAIAAGNNSEIIELLHLPENSEVSIGEFVVTSGDGAYYPSGLPLGIIANIEDKRVYVKPLIDWGRLEYVSVISYR